MHVVFKSVFFCDTILNTEKVKKLILFTSKGGGGLKPKYWELSCAIKMKFCIIEKFNNSIATKMCADLLKSVFFNSAQHNSMTKFCCALFKCENKLKIGWEN